MQTLSEQGSRNTLNGRSKGIAFLAMLLFALAGLVSGFAVGAFVHPKLGQQANNATPGQTPTIPGQSKTPGSTPHSSNPVPLGFPIIGHVSYTEVANGTTQYTLNAQVFSELANGKQGGPIHASGITCKLWLVQQIPDNGKLKISTSVLQTIRAIQNPITGQVNGVPYPELPLLTFDSNSPQTHYCTSRGKGLWKYQVSASALPGVYDLVVLTDWNGVHYNWSWAQITITK